MNDDRRARLRVWAQYCLMLGGLCLLGGVALLLYAVLTPAPPPRRVYIDWSGPSMAGLAGVGLILPGAVLVGVVVLSAILDRRRN